MSKHEELTKSLRASAAAMPFDAAVAVQYRAAADALEAQTREIERLRQDAARYRWLRERSSTMFVNISINGEGAEIAATLDSAVDAARKQGANHD